MWSNQINDTSIYFSILLHKTEFLPCEKVNEVDLFWQIIIFENAIWYGHYFKRVLWIKWFELNKKISLFLNLKNRDLKMIWYFTLNFKFSLRWISKSLILNCSLGSVSHYISIHFIRGYEVMGSIPVVMRLLLNKIECKPILFIPNYVKFFKPFQIYPNPLIFSKAIQTKCSIHKINLF